MDQLALPDISLQSIFESVLATRNEIHRLSKIEAQFAQLKDYFDDAQLTFAAQQVDYSAAQLLPSIQSDSSC